MATLATIHDQMKENHRPENESILAERINVFDAISGPRVGDWLDFGDGHIVRIAHHWGDSVQPACGNGDTGSFYLGSGFLSYSGSLEPGIDVTRLSSTGNSRSGNVWFFDRDYHRAGGAVYFPAQFRVFSVR